MSRDRLAYDANMQMHLAAGALIRRPPQRLTSPAAVDRIITTDARAIRCTLGHVVVSGQRYHNRATKHQSPSHGHWPITDPLESLHDLTHGLSRMVGDEDVNMVACHFPRDNLELMLTGDPPDQVAHAPSQFPRQHGLPILWNPYDGNFEIGLRVRSKPIMPHATKLHEPFLRLKARGSGVVDWKSTVVNERLP